MYHCQNKVLNGGSNEHIFKSARNYIDKTRESFYASKSIKSERDYHRPYIRGHKTRIKYFIHDFHYHFDSKNVPDAVDRLSLTPCVFELLQFTSDIPRVSKKEKQTYFLKGTTPCGYTFKVIVRKEKDKKKQVGYTLQSYFKDQKKEKP